MIRFEGVSKSFGPVRALMDLSFEARPGTLTAILGADGAGKSTALKTVLGLVRPDSGRVLFKDRPVVEILPAVRRATGYMPGGLGLYPDLTAGETLQFVGAIYGLPRAKSRVRSGELLEQTGLAPFSGRRVSDLSGGMKQKLALCAALVHAPEVLLLDEPTAGIDPVSRLEMFGSLIRLASGGMTILMTTTSMEEAARAEFLVHVWHGRALGGGRIRGLEEKGGRTLQEMVVEGEAAAERERQE